MSRSRIAIVTALCLGLAACSGGPDQALVVESITDDAILPNMEAAVTGLEGLAVAVDDYCTSPGPATLAGAQDAWATAKRGWEPVQPTTYFDPGDMLRTVSKVDYTPASPEGVDRLLESGTVIDATYVDTSAASTQRGLGAIEHLIFRPDPPGERECSLIVPAANVALDAVRRLQEAWTTPVGGQEPFADEFTVTMTSRQALADVVSAIIEVLKRQSLLEIGKALGVSAPEPVPGSMEEGDAGLGAGTYLSQLEGIESWLSTGGETSLIDLIRARSTEVATEIETELAGAVSELDSIQAPLEDLAVTDPAQLMAVYEHLDRLRTLFEADVVSLLDLTIGFSDSDGDSG